MQVFLLFRNNPDDGRRQYLAVYPTREYVEKVKEEFVEEYGDLDDDDYEIIEDELEGTRTEDGESGKMKRDIGTAVRGINGYPWQTETNPVGGFNIVTQGPRWMVPITVAVGLPQETAKLFAVDHNAQLAWRKMQFGKDIDQLDAAKRGLVEQTKQEASKYLRSLGFDPEDRPVGPAGK